MTATLERREVVLMPFECNAQQLRERLDDCVAAVRQSLQSDFMTMPKGEGFLAYPVFEEGYEALKLATGEFANFNPRSLLQAIAQRPVAFIVLRAMLGLTPSEWAYVASQLTDKGVSQGAVRAIERRIRMFPQRPWPTTETTWQRIRALVTAAIRLLRQGAPASLAVDKLHRLDKADTRRGLKDVQAAARIGLPYAMLLYERFLGRPFASHKDSISELIGEGLEVRIETLLAQAGISFRKTKRAERIAGFDQAPDFIIPSEFNVSVVIEAKIAEDDGTARDKVTRVQHLAQISDQRKRKGERGFQVVACIGGRGFGVRKSDLEKLLLATAGKVFTLGTLDRMIECTQLQAFKARGT